MRRRFGGGCWRTGCGGGSGRRPGIERSERAYGDVIERRLAQLDDYLGKLRSLSGVTPEDFNGDSMIRCAIERTLELAIDACLGLARHLVAEAGLRPPATYADTFVVAGEAGLIDSALTETLVRLCGFRNRLVHEGAHLDATLVVSALRDHLDDVDRFAASVRAGPTADRAVNPPGRMPAVVAL